MRVSKYFTASLLCVGLVTAQEYRTIPVGTSGSNILPTIKPSLVLVKFGGVADSKNPLEMDAGEAVISLNWDYSKTLGSLTPRMGYKALYDATAQPLGLYPYYQSTGEKRLLMVRNTTARYASLYYSGNMTYGYAMTYQPSTVISNKLFYASGSPHFTMYNDIALIADGHTPMVRYNGNNADWLVWPRPGAFQLSEIHQHRTVYYLDGDYYYSWRTVLPCSTTTNVGPLTGPSYQIKVDSGMVALSGLNRIIHTRKCGDPDSVIVQVCRTRGYKLSTDSMFSVAILRFGLSDTSLARITYDSIPDDSLGDAQHPYVGKIDTTTRDADMVNDTYYRLGQCALTSMLKGGVAYTGVNHGMTAGDSTWKATRYFTMLYDSATLMASDSSPILRVPRYTNQDSAYVLSIARRPVANATLWTLLCKQREDQDVRKVKDTVAAYDYPAIHLGAGGMTEAWACYLPNTGHSEIDWPDDLTPSQSPPYWDVGLQKYMCHGIRLYDTTTVSTRIEAANVIDTIKWTVASDSIYTDIMPWGDASQLPVAEFGNTVMQLAYPTVYEDKIYASQGSKVWYTVISIVPEIARWLPNKAFAVSPDDGDEITGLYVDEGSLLIFKNRSIWRAREAGEVHQIDNVVKGIGCVAPRSIVAMPTGGYAFLSGNGVYAFSPALQSQYKETGGNLPGISGPIQNHLDKYTVETLRQCCAWVTSDQRNLVFSFPTVDTSWVYSIPTGQWSAWTIAAAGVANYDTTTQTGHRPMTDVVFYRSGHDSLYLYGSGKYDVATPITAIWKSGPLFVSNEKGQLTDLGVWKISDTSGVSNITISDEDGADIVTKVDSTQYRYKRHMLTPKEAMYIQFKLQTSVDSFALQGLNLWWQLSNEGGGQ